jgi:hypothetical protein
MDVKSYCEQTGAKRFKRTKDEMARGLSPQEALDERLRNQSRETNTRASTSRKGDIVIRIRPAAGVDSDYFEKIPQQESEIVLDEQWYAWLDTKLDVPYDGDTKRLMTDIMTFGMGEVISKMQFASDLENHGS